MALNPAFASASVNPSQSMGSDASAPAQGALPTGMPQNTGFSGLGGLDINYSAPKEPVVPNIANFNQSYYQSPQYQSYLNNMPQYGTDDMSPMPFGGYGSSSIGNYQQQSYDDFLKNPSMGQPQGNMPPMPQGNMPQIGRPLGRFNPATTLPDGTRNSEGGSYEYPQQPQAPYNNGQLRYDSGDNVMPQVGNLGNDVEIPKLNYLGYKPGWQQEADNTWSYNTDNMSPYNQYDQDWNPQYIGYRGVTNDMYQDALNRGDFSGITDKYTSFTKPRYMSFGNDKTDYSQLGLSQNALDALKMQSGAADLGQFYYDTQTGMFNQGAGRPGPNTPGQRIYTGMTDIPLDVINKLGSGEEIDFSPYRRYTNGFNTEGQPNPPQIGDQPLPVQQPQPDGTTLRDIAGLQEPMPEQQPMPTQRNPLTPTATPTGTPTNLPTGWKSNPVNALFQGDLPGRIYRQSDGSYLDESGKPADMNNYQIPRQPLATPTGTTPMATNPLSQVPVPQAAAFTPAPIVGTPSSGGGSFTQGAPLPNITTTQQQVTAAPEFYTDYLNQLAKQGASTAQNAQYVGATDLQNQAFDRTSQNVGNYQSALQNAINLAQNVGSSNLSEAIGNLGQANIARNLAPQATAGIVGSGQFGSKRGAAALGDTIANAQLGITAQQATALQQDMQNRLAAAQQLGNLASTTQQLGLGDINALATMGGQKQTIAQNEQLFPMQQLTNQSQLLRGYTIPTSTGSSYTGPIPGAYAASPLQQIAGLGALGAGISNTPLGSALFGTSPTIDPKTGLVTNAGTSGIIGKGITALTGGAKDLFSYLNTPGTNETNLPPITIPGGDTATPNGDGTYTTSDGRIVGVDGNPIPGYVYPDPGGNNETPFPGNFDYNDTTPPIPTDETYNSWFGD